MDIELARTFLVILETGSFLGASQKLYVTQSTVSARVKLLEDLLGVALFDRYHAGVRPTPAGLRFRRAAITMVRAWAQARQDAALPHHVFVGLSLGAQITHWDGALTNWVVWLREFYPNIALIAEVASNNALLRQVDEGRLDAAIVYRPHQSSELCVEELFRDDLVLVGSAEETPGPGDPDYIFVDWGEDFGSAHAITFQDCHPPTMRFSAGIPALDLLLQRGGSGYFPYRMVARHIKAGRLFEPRDAPRFERAAYLIRPEEYRESGVHSALDGLRQFFETGSVVPETTGR
ncbi:MAG: LysR family transcriptional regulator [Proteobacteria bacterium]|nr:LysR family transcriptional regulator [Pseudomonadota bacterium]